MNLKVPSSLKQEHEELRQKLVEIVMLPGRTGKLARELSELVYSHFLKEEKYVLPLLALLNQLSQGYLTREMELALPLTSQFKKSLFFEI